MKHNKRQLESGAAHFLAIAFFLALVGLVGFVGYNAWQRQATNAGSTGTVGRGSLGNTNGKVLLTSGETYDTNTAAIVKLPAAESNAFAFRTSDYSRYRFTASRDGKMLARVNFTTPPSGKRFQVDVVSSEATSNLDSYRIFTLPATFRGEDEQGSQLLWSPDGQWFAVFENAAVDNPRIWVSKSNGSSGKYFANKPGTLGGFSWSADSKALLSVKSEKVMSNGAETTKFNLCTASLGAPAEVCNVIPGMNNKNIANAKAIDASSDGKLLLVSVSRRNPASDTYSRDILTVDIANRNLVKILPEGNDSGVFSPDSKKIIARAKASNVPNPHVIMNVDGSGIVSLPSTFAGASTPLAWLNVPSDQVEKLYGKLSASASIKRGKTIKPTMTFKNTGTTTLKVAVKKTTIDPNKGGTTSYKGRTITLAPGKSYKYTVASYKVSKSSKATKANVRVSGGIVGGSQFSFDKSFKIVK